MRKVISGGMALLLFITAGCGAGPSATSKSVKAPNAKFSTKFTAGITHINGRYRFTDNNFLLEGAQRIHQLGSNSIFIYLDPWFRSEYPDEATTMWPAADPANLAELAKTAPYDQVFNMPFQTVVMTTFTFSNKDWVQGMANSPARQNAEEEEFYQLTKYLYSRFSGSGKTFILKNWETDGFAAGMGNTTGNIPQNVIDDLIAWFNARQLGVRRARDEANDPTVRVFNGAEVNRVLDYAQQGLTRVIDGVIPYVNADMLTYSSYDSTAHGTNAQWVQQNFTNALQTIDKFAPDPQGLGKRRILISEYGLFENELVGQASWRTQAILSTAKSYGVYGAFVWNVYDNECKSNGQYLPVASAVGSALRPSDANCRGLWIYRPDGSTGPVLDVLKQYW